MAIKLKSIDRQIITALKADGRRSYTSIAEELNVSEGAVRYRAQKLMVEGVVQVVAVTDPMRVGFSHFYMVDVATEPGQAPAVAERLAQIKDVIWVALIDSGPFKVRVEVIAHDTAQYRDILFGQIESVEGVLQTRSQSILKIVKRNYGWGVPEHVVSA